MTFSNARNIKYCVLKVNTKIIDFTKIIVQHTAMQKKDSISATLERIQKIKLWARRIETLKKRKVSPLSERQFCIKYGFDITNFNRVKKGKILVRQRFFDSVEKALAKERV